VHKLARRLSEQSALFWSVTHYFKEMFITLSNHPSKPSKFCLWIGNNTFSGIRWLRQLDEMAANFLHGLYNWTQLLLPHLLLWGSKVNLGMLLCTWKWIFQLHKRWGICWTAERQSTFSYNVETWYFLLVVTLYSHVGCWCFGGMHCLHLEGETEHTFLQNTGICLPHCMMSRWWQIEK
jgi:hypothetical protein